MSSCFTSLSTGRIRLLQFLALNTILFLRVATQLKQTPVAVMGSRKLMDYLSDTTPSKTEADDTEVIEKEKKDNNNEVEMNNWSLEKDA